MPSIAIGTLISPGPSLYGPRWLTPAAKTGRLTSRNASTSLTAAFNTNPPTFRLAAWANINSPMSEFVRSPPASQTIISPGSAISMALCNIRLSPGRDLTVNAAPAI